MKYSYLFYCGRFERKKVGILNMENVRGVKRSRGGKIKKPGCGGWTAARALKGCRDDELGAGGKGSSSSSTLASGIDQGSKKLCDQMHKNTAPIKISGCFLSSFGLSLRTKSVLRLSVVCELSRFQERVFSHRRCSGPATDLRVRFLRLRELRAR